MLYSVCIFSGMLFLSTCWGQQDICNYDPDVIFFDNDQLEKLRKSILEGDCSPTSVGWKLLNDDDPRNNFANEMEMEDLSRGSRVRFPEDRKKGPEMFLESESHHGPHQHLPSVRLHKQSNRGYHKAPYRPTIPRRFHPGRRLKRQIQNSDLFVSQVVRQPKFFEPNNERLQNNFLTQHSQNQRNKNDMFKDQRRYQNSPKMPSLDLFRPIEQDKPLLPNDDRIEQNKKYSLDFFRPSDKTFADQTSLQKQRQRSKNKKPSNQRVPPVLRRPQTTTPSAMEATTLPGPPTWATAPSLCVQRCPNTPEYNPVCGTDRVTYVNPGRLRCEQRCGKGISLIILF